MKKMILPLLLVAFAYGCSPEDVSPSNASTTDQRTHTEPLTILKTYNEAIGQLEAYYVNEQFTQTVGEKDIHLTVTSVEYGNVFMNEEDRGIYEDIGDEFGKNVYLKIGVTIDGDFEHFKDKTFFADQSEIEIMDIITLADSTFSDHVKFEGEAVLAPITGYLYFITDAEFPIEKVKLMTPAPFHNADNRPIFYPYEMELNLKTK